MSSAASTGSGADGQLPRPGTYELDEASVIVVPVPGEGFTTFRLLKHREPGLHDFEPRRSRAQAVRLGLPEIFRISVSHWSSAEQARDQSTSNVTFIAVLELRAEMELVRLASTEQWGVGHIDIWADPDTLLGAVAQVETRQRRS